MSNTCPVCLNSASSGRDRDYGDKKQVNCPRCGPYEITRTALVMLSRRLDQDLLARARLSHAIRSRTSEDNWLFISSSNLDELVQQKLPGIPQQLEHLVSWLAAQLGEDTFGRIPYPNIELLAGKIGVVDGSRVERLIEYASSEGLIECDTTTEMIGLSPKGWSKVEPPAKHEMQLQKSDTVIQSAKVDRAHCNICGGEKNAYIRASYTLSGKDGEVSWSDTYEILECCGCNGLSVRKMEWISEWDTLDTDPLTGQPRLISGSKVTNWPPTTKRKQPEWLDHLDDDVLRSVIQEVYQALNSGLIVLASIGIRTLLDRAMLLRVGDPRGGFEGKLKLMVEKGHIGSDEKEILEAITDAGSAAAHRGFAPSPSIHTQHNY